MKKRTKMGIWVSQIAARNAWSELVQSEDEKYLRKTYLIPKEFGIDTELAIYDNKVLMASFSAERPLAVIVEDKGIAESLKTIFRYVETTIAKG
ncbi:MAG TPA: hypothetical protein VJB65_04225 [Patescibacteria group bacterium]|nr:hypothetical protein [Patescibacteria group bacterium]